MMLSQPFREATINPAATTTRTSPAMSRVFSLALPTYHMVKNRPTKMTAVPRSGWTMIRAMGIRVSRAACTTPLTL